MLSKEKFLLTILSHGLLLNIPLMKLYQPRKKLYTNVGSFKLLIWGLILLCIRDFSSWSSKLRGALIWSIELIKKLLLEDLGNLSEFHGRLPTLKIILLSSSTILFFQIAKDIIMGISRAESKRNMAIFFKVGTTNSYNSTSVRMPPLLWIWAVGCAPTPSILKRLDFKWTATMVTRTHLN